ncbi:TonB-dependent receptor [Phenylobacterium sp.]|uniref:TonB-dependent receptor n=1 Tax=Phenylobacterium sp. TaxID=1871053 RepID=UPI0012104AC7|nr:TonB-dependent receptor [Phenylobacterium sp.]THD59900.1 MAG: TonB-dependent receptor [Phenylobacterium sp.]
MTASALTRSLLLGASLVALAAPGLAHAQAAANPPASPAASSTAEVETLVVTAAKRSQDLQDVPMSVSAFSGASLERQGIVDFDSIARQMPSVQLSSANNNRNTTVLVRGIGSSGTNPGIEPSVGIFLDGVFMPAAGPIQSNIQDIASVEVLRGPQGTLYGRNTPVGAINIVTRDPTATPEAGFTAGVGNFEEYHLQGYVGGAIADNLNGRLTAWVNSHDGYEKNLYDGSRTNDGEQEGVRARIKWAPTDDITGNFIAYYTRLDAHCCTGEPVNPTGPGGIATPGFLAAMIAAGHPFTKLTSLDFTVDDETVGNDVTQIYGTSAQFDVKTLGGHTLTSITAFNEFYDDIKVLSADGLPIDVGTGPQPLKTLSYSEELRIASPTGQRLEYLGGIYLFRETVNYQNELTAHVGANRVFGAAGKITPGDSTFFFFDQTTKSAAAFGQATFHVTDDWRFTGGLRYSSDDKDAVTASNDNAGVSAAFKAAFPINPVQKLSRNDQKLTWTLGTQYDVTRHVMAYALASTGFKDGGFNARQTAAGTPLAFNPETSITYEVGLKSTFFDRKVLLNADVFRMDLDNFQDSTLNPLTGIGFVVGNAGDRRIDGLEADVQWAPIEHLTIAASGQINDAKFTSYPSAQCFAGATPNGVAPGTCNYTGLRPAFNPASSGSLSANWDAPLGSTGLEGFVNGSVTYQAKQYEDSTLDPRSLQGAYSLLNLRVGVGSESGNWKVSLFGKNLANKAYYVAEAAQPLGGLISAGGSAAAGGFFGWYGEPRTFGVELTVKH